MKTILRCIGALRMHAKRSCRWTRLSRDRKHKRATCLLRAASPPKMEKPTAVEKDLSRAAYKDPFIAEDARTTAKLKNICRGC